MPASPSYSTRLLAHRFDAADHAAALELLAPGCVYHFRGTVMEGREAIVASYDAAHEDAVKTFDGVEYASSVRTDKDDPERSAIIRFVDLLTHKGVTHRHECEQRVTIGDEPDCAVAGGSKDDTRGMIVRIEHIDLPGEREKLNAFLERVGLPTR